jgi:hypothetical protein
MSAATQSTFATDTSTFWRPLWTMVGQNIGGVGGAILDYYTGGSLNLSGNLSQLGKVAGGGSPGEQWKKMYSVSDPLSTDQYSSEVQDRQTDAGIKKDISPSEKTLNIATGINDFIYNFAGSNNIFGNSKDAKAGKQSPVEQVISEITGLFDKTGNTKKNNSFDVTKAIEKNTLDINNNFLNGPNWETDLNPIQNKDLSNVRNVFDKKTENNLSPFVYNKMNGLSKFDVQANRDFSYGGLFNPALKMASKGMQNAIPMVGNQDIVLEKQETTDLVDPEEEINEPFKFRFENNLFGL